MKTLFFNEQSGAWFLVANTVYGYKGRVTTGNSNSTLPCSSPDIKVAIDLDTVDYLKDKFSNKAHYLKDDDYYSI